MQVKKYKQLIERYLAQSISVEEFEKTYLALFKSEPVGLNEALYLILDRLFADVDSYWYEVTPDTESEFDISEETLRREAASALEKIDQYILDEEREADNGQ